MKDKVVLVSDLNMADPDFPPSQKKRFMDFLEKFGHVILGDVLD